MTAFVKARLESATEGGWARSAKAPAGDTEPIASAADGVDSLGFRVSCSRKMDSSSYLLNSAVLCHVLTIVKTSDALTRSSKKRQTPLVRFVSNHRF